MAMKKGVAVATPDAYAAALGGWQRACVEGLREVLCGPSAPLRILGEHVEQHTGVRQGSQRHGSGFTAG